MGLAEQNRVGDPGHDCRCVCGSLIARLVDGGVELKCRRCKRTMVVPLTPPGGSLASAFVPAGDSG